MPDVRDVCRYLDMAFPIRRAADWDNVGLLLGSNDAPATSIFTCLTVTPEVVNQAVAAGAQLIVSHHPILFRAVKNLSTSNAEGRLLAPLLRAGIAVYSPHSAFDDGPGGINDDLADRLELIGLRPLRPHPPEEVFKLVVFVPEPDLGKVSEALFAAGAGRIGNYRECSFRTSGTGTFFPTDGSNPTVGERGRREEVAELRLEVVLQKHLVDVAVRALRAAHSYEEPAFDLIPVELPATLGSGRIGRLPQPLPLLELVERAKAKLDAACVQFVGDPERRISTVALACGAAGEYLQDAIRAGADAFLTGEVRFHDGLAAEAASIALILPGHFATERPAVVRLAERLALAFPDAVVAAAHENDPFRIAGD